MLPSGSGGASVCQAGMPWCRVAAGSPSCPAVGVVWSQVFEACVAGSHARPSWTWSAGCSVPWSCPWQDAMAEPYRALGEPRSHWASPACGLCPGRLAEMPVDLSCLHLLSLSLRHLGPGDRLLAASPTLRASPSVPSPLGPRSGALAGPFLCLWVTRPVPCITSASLEHSSSDHSAAEFRMPPLAPGRWWASAKASCTRGSSRSGSGTWTPVQRAVAPPRRPPSPPRSRCHSSGQAHPELSRGPLCESACGVGPGVVTHAWEGGFPGGVGGLEKGRSGWAWAQSVGGGGQRVTLQPDSGCGQAFSASSQAGGWVLRGGIALLAPELHPRLQGRSRGGWDQRQSKGGQGCHGQIGAAKQRSELMRKTETCSVPQGRIGQGKHSPPLPSLTFALVGD